MQAFACLQGCKRAVPEAWLLFLNDLLEPEDIPTLQEYLGYCLIPSTKAQKMLMIIGTICLHCSIKLISVRCLSLESSGSYLQLQRMQLYLSLCTLITNMLDNAIEALEERKGIAGERYVDLEFIYSKAGLMILCENPLLGQRPKIQGGTLFSKRKEPFHGLGISIMERIVQDACGQLDVIMNNKLFRVFALIPPSNVNETETDKQHENDRESH